MPIPCNQRELTYGLGVFASDYNDWEHSKRVHATRIVPVRYFKENAGLTLNIGDILHMSMTPAPSN